MYGPGGSGTCEWGCDAVGSEGWGCQCGLLGWVGPCCLGDPGGGGWWSESFGAGGVGSVEDGLASGSDGGVAAVVDVGGGVEPDAGVAVVVVVVSEEPVAERAGVVDAGEALRERRGVFQSLELGFAEGVVVAHVGPDVRLLDPKGGEELADGLGGHRAAAGGV